VKYVYTISTIDANGVESPESVCDTEIIVQVLPPSLSALFLFLFIASVSLLALVGICGGFYNWNFLRIFRIYKVDFEN
jgi:hypothetical protein